ncbi:MAG: hypothetical protein AB7V14_02195 [Kiritimatiellia bacterium]
MAGPFDSRSASNVRRPVKDPGPRISGLFLHASAVVVGGGAVLFLGHSTAGKSTIARLLGTTFPVLADDAVFASKGADGAWRVVDGGFRFGKGWNLAGWQEFVRKRSAAGEGIPLRGCLRIYKAETARIDPLEPLELARCLMDAAMEIDLQRKVGRSIKGMPPGPQALEPVRRKRRQWFGWVAEIARGCPGWNLWFSKDFPETQLARIIRTAIEGGMV